MPQKSPAIALLNQSTGVWELLGRLHYMLKCAPRHFESELGLDFYGRVIWGQRQKVIGKRLGVWQGWKEAGSCAISLLAALSQTELQGAPQYHIVAKPPSYRK